MPLVAAWYDQKRLAVQAAVNSAVKAQKETYFQEREQRGQSLSALVDNLRQSVRETLSRIRYIIADPE
jgi:Arc/MetJ family transcription regulator